MLLQRLVIQKKESFLNVLSFWVVYQYIAQFGACFVVENDLPKFECLEGFAGAKVIAKEFEPFLKECSFDKTQPIECQKHCLARKLGLILDGKIWLYKLAITLKLMFPGQVGKDSWDKMIDVILECTDRHYKAMGPLTPFHCYREKTMWLCIMNSVEIVCQNNHRHHIEAQKTRDKKKKHDDELVDDGDGEPKEDAGAYRTAEDLKNKKKNKEMVLKDY